jgi:short-subunit dehydrogenase
MRTATQSPSCTRCDANGVVEAALVTGANSGIGRAFAIALSERQQPVVLLGRNEPSLNDVASQIHSLRGNWPQVVAVDLADSNAPSTLLRHLWRHRLRVSTLINSAGIGQRVDFAQQSRRSIRQTIDVNLVAVVELTRVLLPHMLRRRRGAVINISSMAAFEPSPSFAVYAGTKSFLQNFTESLAQEVESKGVHVALVCPGVTRTPFLETVGITPDQIPPKAQTPEEVVHETLAAIDQRQHLVIPGFSNRIRIWAQRASLRTVLKGARRCLRMLRG